MRTLRRLHRVDAAIAELALRQYGVVASRQLRDLGLDKQAVGRRLRAGRLHRVHRGVYAVGHARLGRPGVWMAAVLAVEASVLSHRAAAALWAIRPSDRVQITAPRPVRRRAGIEIHESSPAPDEITVHEGIPVTTPARTLLDLAAVLTPTDLEKAVNQAEIRRLGSPTSLAALVARYPRRPGTPKMRALLGSRKIGTHITRHELEHRFLAFLDANGLSRPRTNHWIRLHDGAHIEADCHWPEANLIVELDGGATHHTRAAFESDRARDRRTVASGLRVVRVTWRQLHDDPTPLAADLRAILEAKYPEPTTP